MSLGQTEVVFAAAEAKRLWKARSLQNINLIKPVYADEELRGDGQ